MNYEEICGKILELDKKIRYVGIYDFGELYERFRPGLKSYLSKKETEMSLSQAVYRWSTRKKISGKVGNPVFALTKYEKIIRITIPINRAGLILISTELDVNLIETTEKIIQIKNKYS